jgi:hypothetical protein
MGTSGNATSSPFGTFEDSGLPAAQPDFQGEVAPITGTATETGTSTQGARLFKLEGAPVAGFVALTRGSSTAVRYADRATGNIFETTLPQVAKARLTNTTLPEIYEAYFRSDGGAVLFRALGEDDAVKNMSLALTAPKSTPASTSSPQGANAFYTAELTLLRGNLDSLSRGTGDTLFYVVRDSNGIVSSKFNGDGQKTLWKGTFTSWRTAPLGSSLLVFTKPAFSLPGYAYRLANESLTKLLGPLSGLIVSANPAGTYLIYSYSDGSTTHLLSKAVAGSGETELAPTTLADKCVGSASEKAVFYCGAPAEGVAGAEPDLWYQGKVNFTDDIWRFDVATGEATLVLQPALDFGLSLDVLEPQLSSDGRYLVFINKTDLSLWAAALR